MKRQVLGIALAFLPACITASPVAEEQKSAEQQLRDDIGPMCEKGCQKNAECGFETGDDCPAHCQEYLSAFVGHGEQCVELGQELVACVAKLETCEDYADTSECDVSALEHARCEADTDSPPPVFCEVGGGTGSGPATGGVAGGPGQAASCDLYLDECSDGAQYRVSCHPIDDTLMVCNCFRDGFVSGDAFTPIAGDCPSEEEINEPCGWNLLH